MNSRPVNVVTFGEARSRLADLPNDHALDLGEAGLSLGLAAVAGLQDVAAGRVLDEAELDRAIAPPIT